MSDPEDEPDEIWTPEDEARMQATVREAELFFEAEATRLFGPPEVRARKNQRYASRLIRRYSEPVIRGILQALSSLSSPQCAANLADYDLGSLPLAEIIQPFAIYGLHFRVLSVAGAEFVVSLGQGYDKTGSGGEFLLE